MGNGYRRLTNSIHDGFRSVWSSNRRRRQIIAFLCFLPLAIWIFYLIIHSDFYLTRMTNPTVAIQQPELGRCCLNDGDKKDLCGRTHCWYCGTRSNTSLLEDETTRKAFFLETSGANQLDYRQSCAVESLALMNPNMTIHLLMTGDVNSSASTIRTLSAAYPNLHITKILLGEFILHTPLSHWYFCTTWNYGPWAVPHLSDGLRLLTLFKYGGYYFDLDVIQLRPISVMQTNFVVAEDGKKVGNTVLHFDHKKQPLIRLALEEFYFNYRRESWAHNGPDLLTRLLKSWCHVDRVTKMTQEACRGFNVLPPYSFFPVWYMRWREFFYDRKPDEAPDWDESTIGAHIWNSNSAGWPIRKKSNQFYVQMARRSCPLTLSIAPEEF